MGWLRLWLLCQPYTSQARAPEQDSSVNGGDSPVLKGTESCLLQQGNDKCAKGTESGLWRPGCCLYNLHQVISYPSGAGPQDYVTELSSFLSTGRRWPPRAPWPGTRLEMQMGRAESTRKEQNIPGGGRSLVLPTTGCWSFRSVCIWFPPDFSVIGQSRTHASPVK